MPCFGITKTIHVVKRHMTRWYEEDCHTLNFCACSCAVKSEIPCLGNSEEGEGEPFRFPSMYLSGSKHSRGAPTATAITMKSGQMCEIDQSFLWWCGK